MKRKLKWIGVVLVVLLLGFGTVLFLWPRDRITAESWQKIRLGMTEDEVENILGGSGLCRKEFWNYYFTTVLHGTHLWEPQDRILNLQTSKYWKGPCAAIIIDFDHENRVVCKGFSEVQFSDPSFIDRLRDWLGW
jgi:hypothetical protein